jgi:hypothetical protein
MDGGGKECIYKFGAKTSSRNIEDNIKVVLTETGCQELEVGVTGLGSC